MYSCFIHGQQKGSRRYYPTRLATTLTSGTTALTISGSDPSVSAGSKRRHGSVVGPGADDQENETGFVILETNYRLYAYTGILLFYILGRGAAAISIQYRSCCILTTYLFGVIF